MSTVLALLLLAAQPGSVDRREVTPLLDFRYSWPAEAEAIPALRAELRRRMAAAHAEALAGAREVLVSGTVKDLVAGSGLSFEDAGTHVLKGVPGAWRIYRVVSW